MSFTPHPDSGDMESGTGRWSAPGFTLSASAAVAHAGAQSLSVVSGGGDNIVTVTSPTPLDPLSFPVVGGTAAVIDGWAYTDDAVFESWQVNWQAYDGAGTPGTNVTIVEAVVVGSWVHLVAPSLALAGTEVWLRGVLLAITTGGGVATTVAGDEVFWDDFHFAAPGGAVGWVVG